jgi:hypothetical protein
MDTVEMEPEHEQDHAVSVVQRQRRRRCGVLSLGISGSEEAGRAAFERRGPWPAGKIATITIELMGQQMTSSTVGRAGTYARFLILGRVQGPGPRSSATGTSCLRVASPWPAAG